MEIKTYHVEELAYEEAKEINGGELVTLLAILTGVIVGAILGYAIVDIIHSN